MASRRETQEQQKGVEQALRGLLGGPMKSGAMLPSVSDLAQEHGVSRYIAHRALQTVCEEGLFRAVPKVGSFASPQTGATASHVVLADEVSPHPYRVELQSGFDSRIAWHGGAALELSASSGAWRELAIEGAFLLVREERLEAVASLGLLHADVPCVRIGSHWREGERLDLVSFDNEDGGYRATRHLLSRGFRSIAFVGAHSLAEGKSAKEWSGEREQGWRRALHEAGLPYHGMAFHPETEADDGQGARSVGYALSKVLLARADVRALVAASDAVALGIIDALRERGISQSQWPAMVAFDNSEEARRLGITSLRLPWNELGGEAADLLWSRASGALPSKRQHRAVPMRLIPRLSCREVWPSVFLTK